ncbi:HypA protein [Apiospora arundinis]|uniref:Zinc metalloprotease mde10 n=1 Tax=Apiospora arundinis TaxID=335852 RepID=A0ABR2IGP7_9PEZI
MRGILRTAVAFIAALAPASDAHSTKRNALNYLSRLDDPTLHTPSHRVHAHSAFELTFLLHDRNDKIRLTLEPNHDVISDTASVQFLGADGTITHEEPISRSDHRVFKGHAYVQHPGHKEWINEGWARITVHRDGPKPIFEGAFRINGDNHHVHTSTNYRKTQHHEDPVVEFAEDEYMIVWRDSDVKLDPFAQDTPGELKRSLRAPSCSSDSLDFNNENTHPIFTGLDARDTSVVDSARLFARQGIDGYKGGNGAGVNLASTIGSTAGCPSTRKVALVGIATDCTYTSQFNSTSSVKAHIIQQVSAASQVYESTFNISIGIQNLTISDATCPGTPPSTAPWNKACGSGTSITDRLNLFSAWRGQFKDRNAYWTLLSTCNTGAAVGLAWLGQLCAEGASPSGEGNETTAGANVVVRTDTEWQVFAHESGHTFGAVHDCMSQTCADGTVTQNQCCPLSSSTCDANQQFIMNPSTGNNIDRFSACSIGNICSAMNRNSVKSSCLSNNKDVVTITGQQCGNGIVEAGEDCDCGGEQGCGNNSCCDAKTCKFKGNSVCDPSNEDCCTPQCQFASGGTVCRASTGSCDPAETCSGTAPTCPKDVKAEDGQKCGSDGAGLTCASGQCTSRDLQCKTIVSNLNGDNSTKSCGSGGCTLSCASAQLGPNACYTLKQYFLDGTPCDGGGKCNNGQCQGSNFLNQAQAWINDNKQIFIPVVAVVGGLILIALLSCLASCCRRRRPRRVMKPTQPNPSWQGGYGGGGAWQAANVARPPPAYGQQGWSPYQQQQQQQYGGGMRRMGSTRYA